MHKEGILKGLGAIIALSMILSLLPASVGAGPQELGDPVLAEAAVETTAQQSASNVFNTLRTFGRQNEGPGDLTVLDPVSGAAVEDPPYTDENSIFDPQGLQAPVKDFITWNPVWMYEAETFDELQAGGLYQRINTGGVNASEKVWFRMWYEPGHWDKDLDADGIYSPTADVVYPAIMQEFTYMLMQGRFHENEPRPNYGPAGATSFVFPVGMRGGDLFAADGSVDTTTSNARYGYGLTSFDGNFDGTPDIVYVDSEATLAAKTGIQVDFDGDGNPIEVLNPDATPLTGDELAIFSLDAMDVPVQGSVQFLDHMVRVESVSDTGARLSVWYLGDLIPRNMGLQSITIGDMWLYGTQFNGTQASPPPAGGYVGPPPPAGPWFVQVTSVDSLAGTAQVRVGRALGAPFSGMEDGPFQTDLQPGDPWYLKRFYVDGHEYNVVALMAPTDETFSFITIRTPVPKIPITIEQHSVRLEGYDFLEWMSVMPPYNHEHYILDDVQAIEEFPEYYDHGPPVDYIYDPPFLGPLVGPVAPILQQNGPFPYYGAGSRSPYWDPREMFLFYVKEDVDRQFVGELREKYGEFPGDADEEFWYSEQWFTLPWQYTEFVLPDIDRDLVTDLYLLTSSFFDQQAIHWLWNMDNDPMEPLTQTIPLGDPIRVNFWYDQFVGGKKYKDSAGLRIYGENSFGAGDTTMTTDPLAAYPVEELPYTDPWAPFNPQLPQAPIKDSITMNPAYMDEFMNSGEELARLYGQIAIDNNNGREKVFPRLWYEPEHLDKILYGTVDTAGIIDATDVYTFPAVMQEFTYMFLDMANNPSHGRPGASNIAFPMATTAAQLPAPSQTAPFGLPPHLQPSFGYGITSFDANFDGVQDITRIHSEATLSTTTGIFADFDGDGVLDDLDTDGAPLTGDELVVMTVGALEVGIGDSVQFLDHLVTLENVTAQGGGQIQLQLWYTGGGLHAVGGGMYSLVPDPVGPATALNQGDMVIAGRDRVNVQKVPAGGTNSGFLYGPWFVWVADVDTNFDTATIIVGRALGATHSAIDDGLGNHDMVPGDPWYLKRFFVDGHEYNVVALRIVPVPGVYPYEFKYITIRTPVPKETFVNTEDSQVLQGYFLGQVWGEDTDVISVMPPFNFDHTIAPDIVALEEWMVDQGPVGEFANPDFYDEDCASLERDEIQAAAPVRIRINEEDVDPQFFGELKELRLLDPNTNLSGWQLRQFHTLPDHYTDLSLPTDQLHLLTTSWLSAESWAHYYACGDTIFTQDDLAGANPAIPISNTATITGTGFYDPQQVAGGPAIPDDLLRVKMWYDARNAEDIYVNRRTLSGTSYTITLDRGWNLISFPILPFDPAIPSVMSGVSGQFDRVLGFHCNVGGLSYDPALPPGISTLQQMDGFHGYWIRMSSPATLVVTGWRIPVGTPQYLCQGWNLTSYLPSVQHPVADALATLGDPPDPYYTVVLGFDGGAMSYYPDLPPGMNTLQNMGTGFGYWIKMIQDGTLVYPNGVAQAEIIANTPAVPEGVHPTNEWVNVLSFRSSLNGEPLAPNTPIEAYDSEGNLAGACVVNADGDFVMAVYRDDPGTDIDEGAEPGEALTFKIDGQVPRYVVGDAPVWTELGARVIVDLSDRGWSYVPMILK